MMGRLLFDCLDINLIAMLLLAFRIARAVAPVPRVGPSDVRRIASDGPRSSAGRATASKLRAIRPTLLRETP